MVDVAKILMKKCALMAPFQKIFSCNFEVLLIGIKANKLSFWTNCLQEKFCMSSCTESAIEHGFPFPWRKDLKHFFLKDRNMSWVVTHEQIECTMIFPKTPKFGTVEY